MTYYGVPNHGALLQANALQHVLQSMGHEVRFLTFDRSYEYISTEQTKKYKIGLKSIPFFFKYTINTGLGNVFYNYKKSNTLKAFRKDYFNLDTSYDEFEGDVVVVGSDEVFSLEIGYNPVMYGYGIKASQIVSYAASFGPTTIKDIYEKEKSSAIALGLQSFSAISVRDLNSQRVINQLTSKEVPLVCDPVILYGYEKEIEAYTPNEADYLVIYAYTDRMNDEEEVRAIREYASNHGLKVYSVGYYHKWCDKSINVSPVELLGWIRNATLTITDTFHGSVMSIICNTPLIVKLRDNANKLEYLMSEYGLLERIINDFQSIEKVSSGKIDFEDVNRRIKDRRKESMEYIKTAIERENAKD